MESVPSYLQEDYFFMAQALEEAKKAIPLGEIPVGAVVVKNGGIISRAHNRRELDKMATAHAEILAIEAACRTLGSWRLCGCQIYVTLEPCPMCSGAIINSRLDRLVYGAADTKAGCCGSIADLFIMPWNHVPIVRSGIMSGESKELLSEFFSNLR